MVKLQKEQQQQQQQKTLTQITITDFFEPKPLL